MENPELDLSRFIRTHVPAEHQTELRRLIKNVIHDARATLLAEIQAAATKSHQDASAWNADHPIIQVNV